MINLWPGRKNRNSKYGSQKPVKLDDFSKSEEAILPKARLERDVEAGPGAIGNVGGGGFGVGIVRTTELEFRTETVDGLSGPETRSDNTQVHETGRSRAW